MNSCHDSARARLCVLMASECRQVFQDDLVCAASIYNKKGGGGFRMLTVVSWDRVEGV